MSLTSNEKYFPNKKRYLSMRYSETNHKFRKRLKTRKIKSHLFYFVFNAKTKRFHFLALRILYPSDILHMIPIIDKTTLIEDGNVPREIQLIHPLQSNWEYCLENFTNEIKGETIRKVFDAYAQ